MQSYDPLKRNSFSPKGMWGAGSSPCHFSRLYPKASRKTAPPGSHRPCRPRMGRCARLRALPAPPATPGHQARGPWPGPASRRPPLGSRAVPRLRGPPATHTQHQHTHRHALLAEEKGGARPKKVDPTVAGTSKRWGGPLPPGPECRRGSRGTRPYGWSQAPRASTLALHVTQ